ncbi:MAG: hypothetical protein VX085_18760, partial [Pseudomonadota bacterium]|nr:hypothetical protein [Pseudomonadota bacterium]
RPDGTTRKHGAILDSIALEGKIRRCGQQAETNPGETSPTTAEAVRLCVGFTACIKVKGTVPPSVSPSAN